jgi:hypothetical protein
MTQQPPHYQGYTITLSYTHHTRYESFGRVIALMHRPLPDNTQQTDIRASGGIRTCNPSKRVPADP